MISSKGKSRHGQVDQLVVEQHGYDDVTFLTRSRQAYLQLVDEIEKRLGMQPRTAEIRQWYRDQKGKGKDVL